MTDPAGTPAPSESLAPSDFLTPPSPISHGPPDLDGTHAPQGGVRVDLTALRRTATDAADLANDAGDRIHVEALTEAIGHAVVAMPAATSTGIAAEVVNATRTALSELAATTASLADGLTQAARGYDLADDRAERRTRLDRG